MATFLQPVSRITSASGSRKIPRRGRRVLNPKPATRSTGQSLPTTTTSGQSTSETHQPKMASSNIEKVKQLGIVTEKPVYSNYNRLKTRIDSFKEFSRTGLPDIRSLAEAGFVFTGNGDAVRCFFCGYGLSGWRKDMCPYVQHALVNKNCPHLINCKGREFVEEVTDATRKPRCEVTDPLEELMKKNDVAVEALKEFGVSELLCRKAIRKLLTTCDKDVFKAMELLSVIESLEEEGEDDQKRTEHDSELSDDESNAKADTDEEINASIEELEEENDRLKDNMLCRICMDAIACIITLPCGHMISCAQCIPALSECAVCRSAIKGTVRARLAT